MENQNYCTHLGHEQIEQYNEMLDECFEPVTIGSFTFSPSDVLFNCDPIAYKMGLDEYVDSMEQCEDGEDEE